LGLYSTYSRPIFGLYWVYIRPIFVDIIHSALGKCFCKEPCESHTDTKFKGIGCGLNCPFLAAGIYSIARPTRIH
jgi:hypothetical protein